MSQTVFGAPAVVTMLNRAFNNASPANAVFNNQVATAGTTEASQTAFALQFGDSFAGLSDAALSARVLGNLGVLPNAELEAAVTQYFADNGLANRGLVVLQLGQILSTLETAPAPQNIFNAAAAAWNTEVEKSFIYSSNPANTTAYAGDFAPTPVDQGQTFTLTTGLDVLNPGALSKVVGLDNAGGVAGGQTFNTGDVINNAKEAAITFSGNSTVAADVNNVTSFNGTMLTNATINAALFDSVANVNNAGGGLGSTLTVTNGDAAATYGIVGDTSAAGINVTLRAAQLAGTADAVKFAVTGAGSIVPGAAGAAPAAVNFAVLTSAATGVEKITVATSGTNVFSLTAASTGTDGTTLEVTGSGNNTITASGLTNVATYDMSTSTGTNTLNVAGALTTSDVVKGGTGADTLRVAQASTAANLSVTGVETLRLSAGSATGSMIFSTAPSFTTVRVDGDTAESGVQTLTNLGNAAVTVDYRGEGLTASAASQQQFNSLTINNSYTGSSDTVAVKVSNGTIVNTVGYNLGTLSISGAETLDINAADVNATATTTFTAITDSTLTNLKVTTAGVVNLGTVTAGNGTNMGVLTQLDLSAVAGLTASSVTLANNSVSSGTVVLAAAGGTTLVLGAESTTDSVIYTGAAGVDTITGAAFTGSLVVDGKAGADQITSGTGNDSLTGGEGADFIFGGTGNDTIILTETVAAIDTVRLGDTVAGALATDADTVTGFAAANDLLQVSKTDLGGAFASVVGAGFSVAADFVTIAGGVATAGSDRLIYNSTNGQLTYDADGNGGGAAVLIATLTGVPTITAANFVVIA